MIIIKSNVMSKVIIFSRRTRMHINYSIDLLIYNLTFHNPPVQAQNEITIFISVSNHPYSLRTYRRSWTLHLCMLASHHMCAVRV